MTQQHPITPPPELMQQWREQAPRYRDGGAGREERLIERAAQWGADQELEACCKWLQCEAGDSATEFVAGDLRAARRPKPLSLKEQALEQLSWIDEHLNMPLHNHCTAIHTIRRALEQLPDYKSEEP